VKRREERDAERRQEQLRRDGYWILAVTVLVVIVIYLLR
jgi:hypothetical protein